MGEPAELEFKEMTFPRRLGLLSDDERRNTTSSSSMSRNRFGCVGMKMLGAEPVEEVEGGVNEAADDPVDALLLLLAFAVRTGGLDAVTTAALTA